VEYLEEEDEKNDFDGRMELMRREKERSKFQGRNSKS